MLPLLDSTDLTDQTWGAFWAGHFKVHSARVKLRALLRRTALGGGLPTTFGERTRGFSGLLERVMQRLCEGFGARLDAADEGRLHGTVAAVDYGQRQSRQVVRAPQ